MKKLFFLFKFFLFSTVIFGQENEMPGFTETKIESGSTFKKYKDGKLDSIIVTMAAVNYGNALIISRTNDEIKIINAEDKNSVIKIGLKNKKQIKTFYFKNKEIMVIESIDFDLNNLPNNAQISRTLHNEVIASYSVKSKLKEIYGEGFPDKRMKLFSRLDLPDNFNDTDEIFNAIGDFFTQQDALLKIYYGNYEEELQPEVLAYLKTNDNGKIKTGVLYDFKNKKTTAKNDYQTYKAGKIIKSSSVTLADFQKIFEEYMKEMGEL